jgi:hypothetical protein
MDFLNPFTDRQVTFLKRITHKQVVNWENLNNYRLFKSIYLLNEHKSIF